MKSLKLDHLNLTVNNFKESVRWSAEVFGFEVVESGYQKGKPWGVIKSDNALLCIYESSDRIQLDPINREHEKFHRIYHFGLRISDRETWEEKLEEKKLETYFNSPVRYPHSTSWYVKDPSGHSIEVSYWDENQETFS